MEAIRLELASRLKGGPREEFFCSKWYGQAKAGGIAESTSFYKFKTVIAQLRAHTVQQELANRWVNAFAKYRLDVF